jgi:ABC-type multidrug transport system fused ATPase/permease subunit
MRELHNYAFEKLTKHSYKFFTNQFTGGLVSKAKRLVRGFENMHDIFLWDFYMTLVMLVGMFYIMYKNVPQIVNGHIVDL